jgi:hypothetical protein
MKNKESEWIWRGRMLSEVGKERVGWGLITRTGCVRDHTEKPLTLVTMCYSLHLKCPPKAIG